MLRHGFTDYLINVIFLVVVLRQARERRLDIGSIVAPMALVVFVATHYVHTIPTGGFDMALTLALMLVGLSLGVLCGYATHVRVDADGTRFARPVAAILLLAGISAAAWPLALVSMALCEVTARLVIVQVRGQQLVPRVPATVTNLPQTPAAGGTTANYELGGMALIDHRSHNVLREVPFQQGARPATSPAFQARR